MAALPPPTWPRDIDSQADLLRYLKAERTPALHDCWYTADFFPPREQAGSDATAYVDDQGVPVSVVVFGSLLCKVTADGDERVCTIRVALSATEELKGLFKDQAARLSDPIQSDGISDIILEIDPQVEPWASPICVAASGGTINVNVSVAEFHVPGEDGELRSSTPRNAAHFALKIGDWVLFQATMHKVYTAEEPGLRTYILRAHHGRRLDFDAVRLSVLNASPPSESSSEAASSHTMSSISHSPPPPSESGSQAPPSESSSEAASSHTMLSISHSPPPPDNALESVSEVSTPLVTGRSRKRKASTSGDQGGSARLRRSGRQSEAKEKTNVSSTNVHNSCA
ncbi:hypothetical protein DFH06DRAFT_1326708 [Mycena polygramma]|nr:hypothetical protein DFH06DRAFT_1326708 [Mycena polygramma]